MRTRTKWATLLGLVSMSAALVHCVGDEPAAPGGGDGGTDDGGPLSDTGPGGDGASNGEGGVDSGSPCAAGVSPCIVQIAGGGQTFCARDFEGKAYCWGDNRSGQLGVSPYPDKHFSAKPLEINLGGQLALSVGVGGSRVLSFGGQVACARTSATGSGPASVYCWGSNNTGQVGKDPAANTEFDDGGYGMISQPTQVAGLSGSTELAVGALHQCALSSAPAIFCWGDNSFQELGRGTPGTFDFAPQPLTFAGSGVTPADVAIGARHTCSANSALGGRVGCVGTNKEGELGRGTSGAADAGVSVLQVDGPVMSKHLATAGQATCAITSANGVVCWGSNESGQVGNGTMTPGAPVTDPVQAGDLNGTTIVSGLQAGYDHFCALLDVPDPVDASVAQNVYCWGNNEVGQCGPGDGGAGAQVLVPYPVPGLPGRAVSLAMGSQASCALFKDGSVWCWGEDYVGELGNAANPGGDAGPVSGPVKITF